MAIHAVLIATFGDWYGGHSFGPRYYADVFPLLVFLLVPVLQWRRGQTTGLRRAFAAMILVLGLAAVWIHSRGALVWATYQWNVIPQEIGASPARLWDWRDPQFLRGLPGWPVPPALPPPSPDPPAGGQRLPDSR